jgi:hypothetical protein
MLTSCDIRRDHGTVWEKIQRLNGFEDICAYWWW